MVLTEEQKERIRVNRERALEIRRRKEKERAENAKQNINLITTAVETKGCSSSSSASNGNVKGGGEETTLHLRNDEQKTGANEKVKQESSDNANEEDDMEIELEEFERGASQYVTKQDATKLYCLPMGTLNVCTFIEKTNPRQAKFSTMKLYERREIRRRARERYGGLEGLKEERRKRELKRFKRDFEEVDKVFKRSKR